MSVIYVQGGGGATVPNATETVSGKIRIATSAEATTGTDDTTAMTPAKTKAAVDAAVIGGVQYQGTFDASSPADLSNAEKGDLYVISGAGTYQGQAWAVGDHLLINDDMGGTVSPSKIDKVDNTDAVTSVAGKTGAVTLVPSDVTGLATVASTGSYSDLSGTPTNVSTFTNDAGYLTDITGENIGDLADVTITNIAAGESLVYNGTLSMFENATISTSVPNASETVAGIIEIATNAEATAATATDKALVPNNLSSINVSTLNNDAGYITSAPVDSVAGKTGVVTLDLNDNTDVSYTAGPGIDNYVLTYDHGTTSWGAEAAPTASPASETVAGIIEIATNAEATAATATDKALVPSNLSSINVSTLNNDAGYITSAPVDSVAGKTGAVTLDLNDNTDVSYTAGPGIDNYVLTYDHGTTSWGAEAAPTASPASETVAGIIEIATNAEATAASATDKALVPSNLSSINVSTLNNDAGYLTNINSESLNDLSDVSYTAGAGIDNYVLTYDHSTTSWGAEPSAGGGSAPTVDVSSPSTDETLNPPSAGVIEEVYIYTPGAAINVNLVAAATVGSGFKYQIKNMSGSHTITIDPNLSETIDGTLTTFALSTQFASVTLITDGSNWFII